MVTNAKEHWSVATLSMALDQVLNPARAPFFYGFSLHVRETEKKKKKRDAGEPCKKMVVLSRRLCMRTGTVMAWVKCYEQSAV